MIFSWFQGMESTSNSLAIVLYIQPVPWSQVPLYEDDEDMDGDNEETDNKTEDVIYMEILGNESLEQQAMTLGESAYN